MPHPKSVQALVHRLGLLANALLDAVGVYQVGRMFGARMPPTLVVPIVIRIKAIQARFDRIVPRIVAGTYQPRRHNPRRKPATPPEPRPAPKPRAESPFRKFGWLDALLPPAIAQQQRGALLGFLRHPETLALIEAAPADMARLFRPLCWALHFRPPDILANPRRPAGTSPPPVKPYVPPPPPPPPMPGPAMPGPGNTPGLHPMQPVPTRRISKRI